MGSIIIPIQLRSLLMNTNTDYDNYDNSGEREHMTFLGKILDHIITIDENAQGAIVNLGMFYLLYMGCLAVFCTNAINIYAGINGLEVGQSYIIASFILLHNILEIQYGPTEKIENHLFSAMIILSFLGCTIGLLQHNWYPSKVFVGDTYCYFAGMTFAVVGILGHFSKTLLLLFVPQIINFIYSIPQLFKLLPCPKHRLPKFNARTGMMEPSKIKRGKGKTEMVNMTLINLLLQTLGPMNEQHLCIVLLMFQTTCCALGLFFRYNLAQLIFD